jgi:two-component system sensor histidine kinase TctE
MTLPRLSVFSSLRARLVAGLLMVGLIGAAGMGALTELQRRSPNDVLEDTTLAVQARSLIRGLTFDAAGRLVSVEIGERWRAAYAMPGAGFFTVFDPRGRPVARSSNLAAPLPREPLAEGQNQSPLALVGALQNLSLTARAPHGYVVVVSRSAPGVLNETSPETWSDFQPLVLLLGVLGFCVAAAWIVAAWSLRPLSRASREAALIGPERLQDRISLAGLPSEVVSLASAVNGALDRVARAYATERRFTADAAHALRTPVAVMDLRLQRAAATGQLDQAGLRADLNQIAQLVSGLLNLARAEQSDPRREEINLARLVREIAAALQPAFDAAGRAIVVEAPESLSIRADARIVRDMLEALIDNALRHGAGEVSVRLSAVFDGCVLVVEDQGKGVPVALQDRMFDRFSKRDANSPGAGLGLSIVRQTARSLGGEARFATPSAIEVVLR